MNQLAGETFLTEALQNPQTTILHFIAEWKISSNLQLQVAIQLWPFTDFCSSIPKNVNKHYVSDA